MPGGGQESATNLSAYRYLQTTVDDMSGWGWFSLCGVGDFVKNQDDPKHNANLLKVPG